MADSFRQLEQGRTVILITHRMAIARVADQIHVMAEGRIVESGTHKQLIALGGGMRMPALPWYWSLSLPTSWNGRWDAYDG